MATEVSIQTTQTPEDPNHVAAMIAKAEGREPPKVEEEAERPAWLPEGFNTPEELAAAYAEATKKPEDESAQAAAEGAEGAVNAAGLDLASLEAKYSEKGEIDATDYEALAKVGISKGMVDSYIAGQVAIGEALTQRVYSHVGGKETLDAMVGWAAEGGLTTDEVAAFNQTIDTGNEAQVKLALDGLKAKYAAAGLNTPKLIGGGRDGAANDVYRSPAEMMRDMNDPRYQNDKAFRADVEAKLSRSSIM